MSEILAKASPVEATNSQYALAQIFEVILGMHINLKIGVCIDHCGNIVLCFSR